jgi:lysyl-tRNA synthetase class 2
MTSVRTRSADRRTPPRSSTGPAPLAKSLPWAPRAVSLAVLTMAVIDLASALTRADRARLRVLRQHVAGGVVSASTALTLATGLLLLLLAGALRRRKRRAWWLTVGLLALSVATHLLKGLDVEEATLALLLLGMMLLLRGEFYALGDPRTRWQAVRVFGALSTLSVLLGVLLIALRADALAEPFRWSRVMPEVLRGLAGLPGPLQWRPSRFGAHSAAQVSDSLLALGLLTCLCSVYLLLRPPSPEAHLTEEDEQRMRELLRQHGDRDSLGYFALRHDKGVTWSASGKSCIARRVVSGVALASGDPLGDPEAWPGAIAAFLQDAERHAWHPAVIGCGEQAGRAWARAGLSVLEIGDEAIVEVGRFTLEGRAMRNVRQAVARVERAGYTCRVSRVGDLAASEVAELRRQADAWRGNETERGFSMALGRLGSAHDPACVVVMAYQEGRLRAFLHFVPWGSDGLSLDLMRRDRTADNGLNELLIVQAVQAAPALGVRRLSLNFAVFRSSLERGEQLGAGPLLRAWYRLLLLASRWWQIESLYRFNAKFAPTWEPRFVCYASAGELPRVALAALEAEAFLVRPSLRRLMPRWRASRTTDRPTPKVTWPQPARTPDPHVCPQEALNGPDLR